MSYEPRIILEYKDLKNIQNQLSVDEIGADTIKQSIARELISALQSHPCEFKGMKLLIFQPEFSSFNERVRKYLTKYKVEHSTDY